MPGKAGSWLGRPFIAYAHQGGAWEAPSSTLFAIRRALELGATGIELDVHATADRQLVVCHDSTVERTTNGQGPICTLSLSELKKLDNAYWFVPGSDETRGLDPESYPDRGRAPHDNDFTVATLLEVLEVMSRYPKAVLNLDIKATAPTVEPYEELLACTLLEHADPQRVMVASFLDTATDAFAQYAPDIATSAGTLAVAEFYRALHHGGSFPQLRHSALQVPMARGGLLLVDEAFVTAAHQQGLAVHVWTINDEAEMSRLLDLEVDGIISDLPTPLVAMVAARTQAPAS